MSSPEEKALRDSWVTPDEFMEGLLRFTKSLQPSIDVCATEENARLPYYFGLEHDALSLDWVASARAVGLATAFWCNPGYSNLLPWVKAAEEAAEDGGTTYLLTHDNYNSDWFRAIDESKYCEATLLLQPRIAFIPAGSIKASSPRGNNMLHIMRKSCTGRRIVTSNWKGW